MDKTEAYIRAIWTIDSETGIEHLLDLNTGAVIAKRFNGKILDPSDPVDINVRPY